MTPAQFWDIEMQNQRNAMQMQQQANLAAQQQQREMVSDIGSALGQFANQYAENKAMDAKAKSYDKIGEIIGSSMFSGNDAAMNALSELKKSKDPREKIMGYEALLSFVGPYSNYIMANRNAGIREKQPYIDAGLEGDRNLAGGEGTVPLPTANEGGSAPTMTPSPDVMAAAGAWYNQASQPPVSISRGAMRPFYRSGR